MGISRIRGVRAVDIGARGRGMVLLDIDLREGVEVGQGCGVDVEAAAFAEAGAAVGAAGLASFAAGAGKGGIAGNGVVDKGNGAAGSIEAAAEAVAAVAAWPRASAAAAGRRAAPGVATDPIQPGAVGARAAGAALS